MKIYHHNDADGRSAGFVVSLFEKDVIKEDFIEVDYVEPLPLDRISKDEKVYFVDYSFDNIKTIKEVQKITDDIIWIDHHASSMELIEKHPELEDIRGYRLEGISGAGLTYMYFKGYLSITECPLYIQYISDFDCWLKKMPDSEHFVLGLQCQPYGPFDKVWKSLEFNYKNTNENNTLCRDLIEDGKIIEKFNQQNDADYVKKYGYEAEFEGHKCLVLNKRCYSAAFGDNINKYDIVSCFVFSGEKFEYTLFSNKKDINCEKIAKKYGGGGHVGAAGFTSDKILFKKVSDK